MKRGIGQLTSSVCEGCREARLLPSERRHLDLRRKTRLAGLNAALGLEAQSPPSCAAASSNHTPAGLDALPAKHAAGPAGTPIGRSLPPEHAYRLPCAWVCFESQQPSAVAPCRHRAPRPRPWRAETCGITRLCLIARAVINYGKRHRVRGGDGLAAALSLIACIP